jgi:transposase
MTAQADHLERAGELLDRLEAARAKLEQTDDPERAVELLAEITELAKEAHAEIEQARREADAQS